MKVMLLFFGLLIMFSIHCFGQQFGGAQIGNNAFQLSPTYGDLLMRRYIDNDLSWKRALVSTSDQLILNCGGDFSTGTYIAGKSVFIEGNMRIGSGNPTSYKLDVNGNLKIGTAVEGSLLHFYGKPNVSWGYLIDNSNQNALTIRSQYEGARAFSIDPFGNIGIGTISPLAQLHIQNSDNTYGAILAQANEKSFQLYTKTVTTQPVDVASFQFGLKYNEDERNGYITFYRGQSTSGGFLGFSTDGQERIRISRDGDVGIGTTTPNHKLEVNGTIRSKEIKVDADNWPDYVFTDDYNLKPLGEVEQFITQNKHLPDVPGAKQMEAEGVNLAEMNKLLLQKIEELTLYLIEQQKEIELLKINQANGTNLPR